MPVPVCVWGVPSIHGVIRVIPAAVYADSAMADWMTHVPEEHRVYAVDQDLDADGQGTVRFYPCWLFFFQDAWINIWRNCLRSGSSYLSLPGECLKLLACALPHTRF